MQLTRFTNAFKRLETPFYFYDWTSWIKHSGCTLNYQKIRLPCAFCHEANANPQILEIIHRAGLGADCVSGNEVQLALDLGLDPDTIVFAGLAKQTRRSYVPAGGIFSFNCESVQEIRVINDLAAQMGKTAGISPG